MFEKLLQKLLKDVVGQFIDGIDTKKLNIGIWSGTVEIVNVSLKPRLLAILGLPYRITYSNISRLFITIPWKNLFTAPLVIEIESIQVLAQNSTYQLSREEEGKIVMLKIKQFIQKLGRELATNKKKEEKDKQKSGGYLENVYLKMLDNLYLTIRNIHFRFEVSRPLKLEIEAAPFSFGITLELIQLFAVDEKGARVFIDRTKLKEDKNILYKKLKLQNFGFYWNYEEKQAILLSLQTQFPVKPTEQRYLKDMLDFKQIMAGKSLSKEKPNYVILINAEGLIKEDNRGKSNSKVTNYEVSFNIKQIKMVLNEKIIQEAVWFMKETAALSKTGGILVPLEVLEKWEGPKNQNFLGLLRKYTISEFWETDSGGKSNSPLTLPQQKILMDYLVENKQSLQVIQNKVKQIIMGDIGNKNAIQKSDIINNWQSIEALMTEQNKIEEGQLELKFNFRMEEFCVFYIDEVKIPIVQLFIKGLQISADSNQEKGLNLEVEIQRLEGLGYDQNPIIRMEHQVETPFKGAKIMKLPRLFFLSYKYKEDIGQEVEIALGGIGFLYDFKTFRELYRLPQKLMGSQPPPTPTSPPSLTTINKITPSSPQVRASKKQELQVNAKRNTGKQQKPLSSQITITVENVSVYILQYTKKTWRLSLSGCQLTNSQSLVPENILVRAVSLSCSDYYICQPFGAKIVLSLREEIPDISVLIQPIKIKINSQILKYLIKIPSCLETYKKNDAISLSSKYGQLCLLEENEKWRKFDGVIIDGLLYLYQKNEQYSKYQLRVVAASRKQNSRRDVLQVTVRGSDRYILMLRNQAQLEQWTKYLNELSDANRKAIAKEEQRGEPAKMMDKIKEKQKEKQKQTGRKYGFNICAMVQQLTVNLYDTEKDQSAVIGIIIRKTIIELMPDPQESTLVQKHELERKPSMRERIKQSAAEQFMSFKELKFSSKFSKKSRQDQEEMFYSPAPSGVERPEQVTKQDEAQDKSGEQKKVQQAKMQEEPKKIMIQIQGLQYWYHKNLRMRVDDGLKQHKQGQMYVEPRSKKSILIQVKFTTNKIKACVQVLNKLHLEYQPYQLLQTLAYLNNRILGVVWAQGSANNEGKGSSQSQIKQASIKAPAHAKTTATVTVEMGQGCQINMWNMLDYASKDQQRQRSQVVSLGFAQLRVSLDQAGTRMQICDIFLNWHAPDSSKRTLVTSFGHKNKLTVQLVPNKMMIKVYELFLPDYQHYLVMRAVDYFLLQVKEALLYPYNFNQYFHKYFEVNKNSEKADQKQKLTVQVPHSRMYRFREWIQKNMTKSQIWDRVKNLYQIQVQIHEGYVELRNLGYLTVGLIQVTNSYAQSFNASIKDHVLCDEYLVEFKDLNIWLIMGDEKPKPEGKNKQETMNMKIQRQISKKRQQSKQQPPLVEEKEQKEERFLTVLNRFSNTLNYIQWRERVESNIIEVLDLDCPFDLSLRVTMFGKYPQYKSLYQNFEASPVNAAMRIRLILSQIHINLLPPEVSALLGFVDGVMANLGYSDDLGFLYGYDERNYKAMYRALTINKGKEAIGNEEGNYVLPVPLQNFLSKDEYTYSPMQFCLQAKSVDIKVVIPPTPPSNKPVRPQEPKIASQDLTGIECSIQFLEIVYTQFPITQTKISFSSLDVLHLCEDTRLKLVEFTSAQERKSRETMFIDNGMSKRDNLSRPDLFNNQKSGNDGGQADNSNLQQKGKQKNKNTQSANEFRNGQQKQIRHAFSLKMYKRPNHKSSQLKRQNKQELKKEQPKTVQQGKQKQVQVMQVYELNSYNVNFNYDVNAINFVFKLKSAIMEQQQKQNQNQRKDNEMPLAAKPLQAEKPRQSTEILCRFHHLLVQVPIPNEPVQDVPINSQSKIQRGQRHSGTLCLIVKCALLTELPEAMPLRVDVQHFQAFLEEPCEDAYDGSRSKSKAYENQEKIVINEVRNSSTLPAKNKKKTLLQPTKLFYSKAISQSEVRIKDKSQKPKQQQSENMVSSRIKSILNIQSDQTNKDKEKDKEAGHNNQRVEKVLATINELKIGKCFVKASVRDLKMLVKLASALSAQAASLIPAKKLAPVAVPPSPKKPETQTVSKKSSLTLEQKKHSAGPYLPTVNKIQFNPLQLVIMNENLISATPLLYSKLLVNYLDFDDIQIELTANYFNLRINAWEPLIETTLLLVKLQPHLSVEKISKNTDDRLSGKSHASRKGKTEPATQQQKSKQCININISTNLLEALIPALESKDTDYSQLRLSEAKSVGDEVNCWMLINHLGYDISCESRDFSRNKMPTVINIPNNKARKLTFLNDVFQGQGFQQVMNSQNEEQQMMSLTDNKNNRWSISITINNEFRIKEIDIGEIGVKKFCFNYEGHPYWIYGHTYVDISKNVKYIKFYSEVLITNSTNLDLWIRLPIKDKDKEEHHETKEAQKPLQEQQQVDGKLKKQRKYSYDIQSNQHKGIESNQLLQVKARDIKNKTQYHASDQMSEDDSINEKLETSFRKAHTNRPEYIKIPANKDVPLAFDLDDSFKRLSQSQFMELISREPVHDHIDQKAKQVNANSAKVQKYQQFQIQKQRKKMRTIYKILASGKIVNKLPQQVTIALKADQHILYTSTLVQDESQFLYTPFSLLELSLYVTGFQWSTFTPCSLVESIGLLDFNENRLNVRINFFVDEDGIDTIILYPIAVLYNDTDYDLHVRDPESRNSSYSKVLPKRTVSLPNNRILVLKPSVPDSTGFTSQYTNYTKIYINQEQLTCKFDLASVSSRPFAQRQLEHIPPTAIETLLINQVSLRSVGSGSTTNSAINTKFVTISHKYYFSNRTDHVVLIRKHMGSSPTGYASSKFAGFNVRVYEPNSLQSFLLFQEDSTAAKSSLAYYELTIKNSPYEWSGALSITKTGSNHFILRNRANFNDVLFMNLAVIKYHKIEKFKIQLREVAPHEVPYTLSNMWPGFVVKLPEYGNLVLKEGDRVDYSWDEPVLKHGVIPILVGKMPDDGIEKVVYSRFEIKTENSQENQLIKFKKFSQLGQITVAQNNLTKNIQIREYHKVERRTQKLTAEVQLPIRIGIINNSFTPVYHLCDFSANISLKINRILEASHMLLALDSIQIDNQTRYRVYFPVVLSTSLAVHIHLGKALEVEVEVKPVMLNIEEDFGRDVYATALLVLALIQEKNGIESEINRLQNETEANRQVLISKLVLPAVSISLQVKTKKLSIETTINLQKPAVTKYPWPSFPYPIKGIAITLLSHLSISPWALISSFQKGVVALLTEQESSKGIEGFFGQIIAALSNSVNGLVGVLVGHDIERVDNFFDGIEQGSSLLVQQVAEIKDCFEPNQCTIPSILAGLSYGLASIVLKPMKGVLQMTLKISEGIKKTALFSFQDLQARFKQRDAIVFYGQQQKFRSYEASQSQLMVLLLKICGEPLKYFHVLRFYLINNKQTNRTSVLCIGTEQVILFDAKLQKMIWQINLHEVTKIEIVRYTCVRFSPQLGEVDLVTEEQTQEVYSLLLKVQKKVFIKA